MDVSFVMSKPRLFRCDGPFQKLVQRYLEGLLSMIEYLMTSVVEVADFIVNRHHGLGGFLTAAVVGNI